MVETTLGQVDATELWIADPDGSNSRRLVGSAASDTVERALAHFSSPAFSPDGRRIYFLSRAWATSDAVHAVDVNTGREWFVADGNSLEVVPRGEFAGCLLVEQHRYRGADSGSYDWTWLLTSNGKTLHVAAKDTAPDVDPLIGWRRAHIPATASGSSSTAVCSPGN
jgi:Tol biopolymer transport system component